MIFVTDDHRTIHVPKETRQTPGVVPDALDPVLLAAIHQTNACSSKVKPAIKNSKTR
ncbi:hypothetical protein NX722_17240 [Endozoicomonas gorgoniicola]|uniref:Uncharacterized protein n=1 Tax=Endozoicomonas gorgoniicola TaxID=1234144 RepID=A0ABT3MY96_9GAMM|nr:hypothetical protein [Endozoicomonas gorgoniicola]MCW7554332.1 hypothetical protein [Endozoicomonas gorgoniicola]